VGGVIPQGSLALLACYGGPYNNLLFANITNFSTHSFTSLAFNEDGSLLVGLLASKDVTIPHMLIGFSLSQLGKVVWSYEMLSSLSIDVANSQNLVVWGNQVFLSLSNDLTAKN
jgi:hypothetical protein